MHAIDYLALVSAKSEHFAATNALTRALEVAAS